MTRAYISLGSNMGDKVAALKQAIELLRAHEGIQVIRVSSIYDTDPVGYEEQDVFMNIIAEVETALTGEELLTVCQSIEEELKRVRVVRWGPRTMDLDIILYDDQVIDSPTLTVPHPRMHERAFVLVPLVELNEQLVHPVYQKTVEQLLSETGYDGVRLFEKWT